MFSAKCLVCFEPFYLKTRLHLHAVKPDKEPSQVALANWMGGQGSLTKPTGFPHQALAIVPTIHLASRNCGYNLEDERLLHLQITYLERKTL